MTALDGEFKVQVDGRILTVTIVTGRNECRASDGEPGDGGDLRCTRPIGLWIDRDGCGVARSRRAMISSIMRSCARSPATFVATVGPAAS